MKLDAHTEVASRLSAAEIDDFCKLVLSCGEVQANGLEELVRAASSLVRLRSGDSLLGVGGLKNPRPKYKARVFQAAGVKTAAVAFALEVGWVAVHPDVRRQGVGRLVMENLLEASAGRACFATCRIENAPMQGLLAAAGFCQLGEAYKSTQGEYQLAIWARGPTAL